MQNNYADDEEIQIDKHSTNNNIYDLMKNIDFSIDAQNSSILLKKDDIQSIKAMISLKTKESEQSAKSSVDLICVIDISDSMEGEKMNMVKKTLKLLLNYLTEKDRLCLVQFNHDAQRLTPLITASPQNKAQFEQVIDFIETDGGTNIASGTQIAFEQIKNRKYRNNVTSIFLLSDGQDRIAEEKNPLTIHSFGYGSDNDAKMMTSLCSLTNGAFYFVLDYTFLNEFFINALGGLVTAVGENIEIQVKTRALAPFDGIRITNTYGNMWEKLDDLNYRIKIPQISWGNNKAFVFQLTVPKYDAQMGDLPQLVQVIDATLELKSTKTNQIVKKQSIIKLNFVEKKEQISQVKVENEVVSQIVRVQATDTIDKAIIDCERRQYEEAQVKLDNTITDIQNTQNVTKVSKGIIQNLEQAKQAAKPLNFEKFGKNQMVQIVSNNYAQVGINANFDENGVQNQQVVVAQYSNNAQKEMVKEVIKNKKKKKVIIQEKLFSDFTVNQLLIGHTGVVLGVDICQERNLLVSGSADKTVKLWNLENNTLIKTYSYKGHVQNVLFSNEGKLLAFGGGYDFYIQLIDISDLEKDVIVTNFRGHKKYINRMVFSNNSQYLISGSDDCTIRIWDIQSQKEAFKFISKEQIKGVSISSDNTLIASNSEKGQISIYNFQNKIEVCSKPTEQGGCGIQFFSNDQKILISSHQQGSIMLWSLENIKDSQLQLLKEFNLDTRMIWTALFTSCSKFILLIANQDGIIKAINSENGDEVYEKEYEQGNYCYSVGVALSKDIRIMSYGQDQNVSVWRKEQQVNE